jgi:hypothetical protein
LKPLKRIAFTLRLTPRSYRAAEEFAGYDLPNYRLDKKGVGYDFDTDPEPHHASEIFML